MDYSLDSTNQVLGWEGLCHHARHAVFGRMGMTDQEIVALLCVVDMSMVDVVHTFRDMLDHGSNIRGRHVGR